MEHKNQCSSHGHGTVGEGVGVFFFNIFTIPINHIAMVLPGLQQNKQSLKIRPYTSNSRDATGSVLQVCGIATESFPLNGIVRLSY